MKNVQNIKIINFFKNEIVCKNYYLFKIILKLNSMQKLLHF